MIRKTALKQRILLVEDEENLRDAVKMNLEEEGYEVDIAATGTQALMRANNAHYHLYILDVMLPEMDGLVVCQGIRLKDGNTPILFLTAKDTSQDKIAGLKIGADDYLTKPFNLEEFLLRVRSLLKRNSSANGDSSAVSIFKFGKNQINFDTLQAIGVKGQEFALSKKEVLILKLLIEKKNTVVSRNHILQSVWGYEVFPNSRSIDNFINSLRHHFETDPSSPEYFHSVRGIGYRFTEKAIEE
ncbi:MAG: response regulator transcription factor [Bacteroidetes bacterium]|nr:response regulator transcription factor [Bacteroidota bacterium]